MDASRGPLKVGAIKGNGGGNLAEIENLFGWKVTIRDSGKDHATKSDYVSLTGPLKTCQEMAEYLQKHYAVKGHPKGKA